MKKTIATIYLALLSFTAYSQQVFDIPFEEFYLDNGLRVVVHEDRKAPIVAVTLWYHVGSKNEQVGKTGFAHLFEHLMFNGTENYNDEYFKPFQEVGATNMNGTTDFDRTNYFETVPSTAVDLALWMESDRMGHLLGAIDQAKLDEQRGVVQNEKRQGDNQPYGKVFEQILTNLFPEGHPYSWDVIGSMEDLNAASLEDVQTWFRTYYGPNNATLVLAGDIDVATARRKVEQYFGDIPPGPPLIKRERWTLEELDEKRILMEDRVPQARIYKTWRGPKWSSDDSPLVELADAVLTSGKTSRLYQRLVYEDQIATDIGAFLFDGEIAGAYIVWATAQPDQDLAEVERVLDEELERFLEEGPTAAELARAKTEIESGFIRGIEQVGGFSGKSNILATNAVYGGSPDYYKHALGLLQQADPRTVRDTARRWLRGNAISLEVQPYENSLSSSGDGVDRSAPPIAQEFPLAPFPDLERTTLSNGMQLIVAERHAVPVVQLDLQVNAGYAADQFGKLGSASLAMSMLDEGTRNRDALEISDALARQGAQIDTDSNLDFSTVSLSALKENLDASLDIYADVVLNPAFPDSELDRLRRLQLSQIQQEKVAPQSMALRVFPKFLYGEDHAYGMGLTGSGTEESVKSMTRADLQEFHNSWFKPNHATMIVVGDITMAEIQPKLERLFANWAPGSTPEKRLTTVDLPSASRVFLLDRPAAEQSYIIAAQLIDAKQESGELSIEAMNDILGGNFTSRINMNLREDKAWSYGARTTIVDTKGQRPFMVLAPVQSDQTGPSIAEIVKEIDKLLGDNPVTAEEVSTSKKRSTLTLPGRWETASAVAGDIAELVRFDLPDNYWDEYAELVDELDATGVNSAARRILAPEQLTWIVVGDLALIESQVRELNLGTVQVIDADGNIINSR
jgi:zinc protease